MTYNDLEKLRQEATPGEWEVEHGQYTSGDYYVRLETCAVPTLVVFEEYTLSEEDYPKAIADANFIAAMHAALPSLLLAAQTLAKLREGEEVDDRLLLPGALFAKLYAICAANVSTIGMLSGEEWALLARLDAARRNRRAMLSATGKGDK